MINLEIPNKFKPLVAQANEVAANVFRPDIPQVRRGRA